MSGAAGAAGAAEAEATTSTSRTRRLGDVLGIGWLVGFIVAYLAPAWKDGASFGPADLGRGLSLLTKLSVPTPLHNNINGDLVTQSAAWNLLDWQSVHAGHFPLWNDLSANGLPQFLNFESAVLSLPTLVGYAFPSPESFLVTVAMKLLIASTGIYVCCRLLGTGPLAAALGGTTAMLAGSFSGWLGWAVSGPDAWTGWLLAGVILAYRRRGAAGAVLLAVATAFAVYAGMPESDLLVGVGLAIVLAVTAVAAVLRRTQFDLHGIARVAAGGVAGFALSAPLWLPGAPILADSARGTKTVSSGIPLHAAVLLFAQGYDGLPIRGSFWFGPSNYFETAAYLGIPALILAVVGVVANWRRPVALGLAAGAVGSLLVIYRLPGGPVQRLLTDVGLGTVALGRMQVVFEALIALLAALGLQAVLTRHRERAVTWSLAGASVLVLLVLAELWRHVGDAGLPPGIGPADAAAGIAVPSHATFASLRRSSLFWPTAEALAMLAGSLVLLLPALRARLGGRFAGIFAAGVLGAESAFLLFAGVGINSYSSDTYPVTPAVAALQRTVGSQLVALDAANVTCPPGPVTSLCGVRLWQGLGLYPEMNLGYGVAELAAHDPVIPQRYFDAWPVPHAGQSGVNLNLNLFAPAVDSAALARTYGVSYVLALPNLPRPAGMVEVTRIAGLALYRVPGSSEFTIGGGDRVTSVGHAKDNAWTLGLSAPRPATLVLHLTEVPGWHVTTSGGTALAVSQAPGDQIEVQVPAGTTSVSVVYWPGRLTLGLALAVVAVLGLAGWPLAAAVLRRRRKERPQPGRRGLDQDEDGPAPTPAEGAGSSADEPVGAGTVGG